MRSPRCDHDSTADPWVRPGLHDGGITRALAWTLGVLAIMALGGCGKDDGGNGGVGPSDTTPPAVTNITPAAGATNIAPNVTVVAEFSEAITAATCTASHFTVSGCTGTVEVSGATATFTPTTGLAMGTMHTVTIKAGVCDAAGNSMAHDFTSTFTTATQAVANAGADRLVNLGQAVALDGSASTSGAGGALTYTWTRLWGGGPPTLTGMQPSFAGADEVTTMGYQLVVSENGVESLPDVVRVFVVEDRLHCYFVHPAGSDQYDGSVAHPFVTIQKAIEQSHSDNAGGDVYVAAGDYEVSLALRSRVSVYGGFNAETWERDPATHPTRILGGTTGVQGDGVQNLRLDGLSIESADATAPGGSSIALHLNGCASVSILNDVIRSGNGSPGAAGGNGLPGAVGNPPNNRDGGGAWPGENNSSGGNGGGGGGWSGGGDTGLKGKGACGGNGGAGGGGVAFGSGHPGSPGQDATCDSWEGENGAGGAACGAMVGVDYVPALAFQGARGINGSGGGGGGGGGGGSFDPGGWGGGGGGGGQGGEGGWGGGGGGASVGILLTGNCASIAIEYTSIHTGNGGLGGPGGQGAVGGLGATGSGGGAGKAGGNGGKGGNGGLGGVGGYGGGGGGGPVIGIWQYQSQSTRQQVEFFLGTPGPGGMRLDGQGVQGAIGEASEFKSQTEITRSMER